MSSYKVQDNSTNGVGTILQMLKHFVPYAQQELGFQKPVMISFQSDEENANKLLGKTGYYNPQDYSIAIYVDSRHPKDVLRSLSHELVHHSQNCNGDFDSGEDLGPGYAQDNPVMRDAELDAYKRGNIIFRDFEDLIKKGKIKVNINFEETGEPKMSLKEWRNGELNQLLMEKWGLAEKRFANDPKLDKDGDGAPKWADKDDEESEIAEGIPYRKEDEEDDQKSEGLANVASGYRKEDEGSEEHNDEEGNRPSFARKMGLKKETLTLDEARDLARRIFEKLTREAK